MRKITADSILLCDGQVLEKSCILLKDDVIVDIVQNSELDLSDVEQYKGVLIPGFINSHCHLELSHMKGVIPSGTGLINFIKAVISQRNHGMETILEAIELADQEMREEGIVAVGDISNKTDTIVTKSNSPIDYYNFIECFDLMQGQQAQVQFQEYHNVFNEFIKHGLTQSTMVPHSPYSVSKEMFDLVRQKNSGIQCTVSIHNQETPGENSLFIDKTGDLLDFYNFVNVSLGSFQPIGMPSINYALPKMDPKNRTLLIHNTESTKADIEYAMEWNPQVYFCTCPNANLYIENKLPDYSNLIESEAKICVGTDSLSSNWQLSILEELKTINKYNSSIPIHDLINWATINGAHALGLENKIGSIEIGKSPGLNLLQVDLENNTFSQKHTTQKIA